MSLLFKAMYAVGFTPWDRTDAIPGDGDQVLDTVATVETGDPPYGRALDIGCGKGRYSIALALRGWQVTGIDAVHKAVMMARERTSRHGAEVRYVEADATRLAAEVPPGFRLVFDGGFFHTLSDEQRSQVVRQENAVTDADATLAMV
ncbi:MAG: class I SAM-dependent methyltransferase, partial [Nocardioidaceae bacterium]